MKSNFNVDKSSLQLEEALAAHEPYAILVVSTTGMDDKNCDKHSPTRVQLVQYEYDEDTKQYTESIPFNKLVAADIEAVNAAIASAEAGGYDALGNAGIDAASYKAQVENPSLAETTPEDQRVLTQAEFKKMFEYVMTAIQHDTTLIANGVEHSRKYLDKIGCADQLSEMIQAGKVLDQPTLSGEYARSHDISTKKSVPLETLRNALKETPKVLEQFATPEMEKDLAELSKEDFLKAHPKTTEKAYDMKIKDMQEREAKATAPERVQIINQYVVAYGREKGVLESQFVAQRAKNTKKSKEAASKRGQRTYDNKDVSRKVQTQIEMGLIDRDEVLNGNSEYQKLMDSLSGKNGNKGVAFVHIATSGMNNPRGNETGLPIQLYVRAVNVDADGKGLDASKTKGYNFYMKTPNSVVLQAEQQAKSGGFNVFKDAGINPEQYKSGAITVAQGKPSLKVHDEAEFAQIINKVFSTDNIDPSQYAIVVLGKSKKDEQAFFQKALGSICNNDIVHADVIDAVQAFAEYALLTTEGAIPENVLFDENSKIQGFGIRDIAQSMGKELNGTSDKVNAMFMAVSALYEQHLELNKEEREQEAPEKPAPEKNGSSLDDFTEVSEIEVPMAETIVEETGKGVAKKIGEENAVEDFVDEFEFADEEGYDGESYQEAPVEAPQSDKEKKLEDMRQQIESQGIEEFFTNAEAKSAKKQPERPKRGWGTVKTDPEDDKKQKTESPAPAPKRGRTVAKTEPEDDKKQKMESPAPAPKQEKTELERPTRKKVGLDDSKLNLEQMSTDIQALYAIVTQQSTVIAQQAEQIASQNKTIQGLSELVAQQGRDSNERMFAVLQQQNELMKTVVMQTMQQPSPTVAPSKGRTAKNKGNQEKFEGDVIERLEQIKDEITNISADVPQKVSDLLYDANSAITEGQQELENPQKDSTDPKPV